MGPAPEWRVSVRFQDRGLLRAEAAGSLPVLPEAALQIITHPAGDELFRVVARRAAAPAAAAASADTAAGDAGSGDGSSSVVETVEVENRAPVRVLIYRFWAVSRVLFSVSLAPPPPPAPLLKRKAAGSGSSLYAPVSGRAGSSVTFNLVTSVRCLLLALHLTTCSLCACVHARSAACSRSLLTPRPTALLCCTFPLQNMLKQLSGAWHLEPLLGPCGCAVEGTRLAYSHDVRPKGLPPGVQFVPGMSGAVRASVAKEVQQMVDKVNYVAEKVRRQVAAACYLN